MKLDAHTVALAIVSVGVGWGMMIAGLQKNAIEWRRRRRICPSCGREIQARVCRVCVEN
jgi:hypothetical protein